MSEWTEAARRAVDDYCARSKAAVAGTGADADEVIDDLRRHIEEEIRAAHITLVTEDDVRRILARVGEPRPAAGQDRPPVLSPPPSVPPSGRQRRRPGFVLLALGCLLPFGTLVFELVTGISAGVLFDPLPGWFQVLAVALVPAANLWLWRAARAHDARPARALAWLNGAALGVSLFYSLLYLPFTPIAAIAVVYFGIGLIPLAPLCALAATGLLRAAYERNLPNTPMPAPWKGALVSLSLLILVQLPTAATYYGLGKACSEDAGDRTHGVRVLRAVGDEELMLRACYGLLRRELDFDIVRSIASGGRTITADQAREAFYRATGRPFNSMPPPALYTRMGRWTQLEEEFTWDDALGGEAVAGHVKGLSLLSSRMDATAEPDAAVVYCEWTLEFKNIASQPREARAQIAIPPGAVVSRVTLWVNGEEREAAFAGRSQARQAYKEVAVVQRRDPILVTTCGPDRVLMQCFPVPPEGGVMKVRLGITAPLILETEDRGRFAWPRFLERNFRVPEDLTHGLWIQSVEPLTGDTNAPPAAPTSTRPFVLHRTISDAELSSAARTVLVHRPSAAGTVWTPAGEAGHVIRQTVRSLQPAPPSRLVVVIDGSHGMREFVPEICTALSAVPESTELALLVAGDRVEEVLAQPRANSPALADELRRKLARITFAGGNDNLPALETAWDLAAAVEQGAVLWIHQPQPVLLSPETGLRQRIERATAPTRLFELQTRNGPDRAVEKLDGLDAIQHVPRLGSVSADLDGLFAIWSGKRRVFDLERERVATGAGAPAGPQVSRHIERLWARDEALRLCSQRRRDAAASLAAEHQLVTPLTGAVVLETREQFARHGLTPVDPATVPSVPEPGAGALGALGYLAFLLARAVRRRPRPRPPA